MLTPGPGSRGRYTRGKAESGLVPAPPRLDFILEIRTRLHLGLPQIAQCEHQILASSVSGQRAIVERVSEARVQGWGVGARAGQLLPAL